jgi:hypothetical protein
MDWLIHKAAPIEFEYEIYRTMFGKKFFEQVLFIFWYKFLNKFIGSK